MVQRGNVLRETGTCCASCLIVARKRSFGFIGLRARAQQFYETSDNLYYVHLTTCLIRLHPLHPSALHAAPFLVRLWSPGRPQIRNQDLVKRFASFRRSTDPMKRLDVRVCEATGSTCRSRNRHQLSLRFSS